MSQEQYELVHVISTYSNSLEVLLMVPMTAREALNCNGCTLYEIVCLVMYNITMVKMRHYKQFGGFIKIFGNFRNRPSVLLTRLQDRRID